jgi:hypothetical protein
VEKVEIPGAFSSVETSNIPAIYKPLYQGGLTDENVKALQDSLPYDSITIFRTGCFGSCPVYQMILHRDGRAELNAKAYLPRLGKFTGEVDIHTYGKLCYLLESSHFSKMSSEYRANWTDDSTCFVTTTNKTEVKTISDYGEVGPIQLWAIQEILDHAKDQIEWKFAN